MLRAPCPVAPLVLQPPSHARSLPTSHNACSSSEAPPEIRRLDQRGNASGEDDLAGCTDRAAAVASPAPSNSSAYAASASRSTGRFLTTGAAFRRDAPLRPRFGPSPEVYARRASVVLIPGRESHTSNLAAFDAQVALLVRNPRSDADAPFCAPLWGVLRQHLAQFTSGVGMRSLPSAQDCFDPGDDILAAYKARVIASAPLMPLDIPYFASAAGIPLQSAIGEFLRATKAGLMKLRFAPMCQVCHGQSRQLASLDELRRLATAEATEDTPSDDSTEFECMLCHAPNHITYLDHVKAVFHLPDGIFYAPMQGPQCTISKLAMSRTLVLQPLPATERGSGFVVRCALAPGRYRMRCPVADTDNTLVVRASADLSAPPCSIDLRVSDLEVRRDTVIEVPHGQVNFCVRPDTKTFFALWIMRQENKDTPKTLVAVPGLENNARFVTASDVARHPYYARFNADTTGVPAPAGQLSLPVREMTVACISHCHVSRGGKFGDWAAQVLNQTAMNALKTAAGEYGTPMAVEGDISVEGGALIACFAAPEEALRCVARVFKSVAASSAAALIEASNSSVMEVPSSPTSAAAVASHEFTGVATAAPAPSTRRFAMLDKSQGTVSVASVVASDHAKQYHAHLRAAILVGPVHMRVFHSTGGCLSPDRSNDGMCFQVQGNLLADVRSAVRLVGENEILLAFPTTSPADALLSQSRLKDLITDLKFFAGGVTVGSPTEILRFGGEDATAAPGREPATTTHEAGSRAFVAARLRAPPAK
jgi:hypothetical protein